MITIALTGGIGSGKSTISNMFSLLKIPIIDADKISKNILTFDNFIHSEILRYFKCKIIDHNGVLNRSALRERIFSFPKERIWVNSLLHPIILKKSLSKIKKFSAFPYVIWVVPLLFESQLEKYANRILSIDTKYSTQIKRVKKRDRINDQQIRNTINVQTSRRERINLSHDIIENQNISFQEIYKKVLLLHKKYLNLSIKTTHTENSRNVF